MQLFMKSGFPQTTLQILQNANSMYKKIQNRQAELTDFNQPLGFKINPLNRWVIKASTIPWDAIEERYASLFPSHTGPAAKPLRKGSGILGSDPFKTHVGPPHEQKYFSLLLLTEICKKLVLTGNDLKTSFEGCSDVLL